MTDSDSGWPASGARFLAELEAHNTRDWFQAHKARHARDLAEPGARCLEALREAFGVLRGRPMEGRVFRLARDMRFARGAAPYHPWLRMAFRAQSEAPGHFLSIEPARVRFGVGCLGFDVAQTTAWRARLVDDAGASFDRAVRTLCADGWRVEPPELKRLPRGLADDLPRAEWLRYKHFALWCDARPGDFPHREALQDWCLAAAREATGLSDWLANALPAGQSCAPRQRR